MFVDTFLYYCTHPQTPIARPIQHIQDLKAEAVRGGVQQTAATQGTPPSLQYDWHHRQCLSCHRQHLFRNTPPCYFDFCLVQLSYSAVFLLLVHRVCIGSCPSHAVVRFFPCRPSPLLNSQPFHAVIRSRLFWFGFWVWVATVQQSHVLQHTHERIALPSAEPN